LRPKIPELFTRNSRVLPYRQYLLFIDPHQWLMIFSLFILLDKGSKFIENYMVIGDLNYDILTPDKSQVLDDLCDIFDLTNNVSVLVCRHA
jgi:hypothetical protein